MIQVDMCFYSKQRWSVACSHNKMDGLMLRGGDSDGYRCYQCSALADNHLYTPDPVHSYSPQPSDACPEKLIPSRHLNNNQQSVGSVTEKLGAAGIAGTLCEGIVIL